MPRVSRIPLTPLAVAALLAGVIAIPLTGCATRPVTHKTTCTVSSSQIPPKSTSGAPSADLTAPVLRYGRYTLVELVAERSQQDLMQQIVDVTLPTTLNVTVGEALRYLLLWTGFQLCDHSDASQVLDTMPLPAAHIHLGPLTLREALEVIAGPAWSLTIDDSTRRVCFGASGASASTPSPSTRPTT